MQMNAEKVAINLQDFYPPSFTGAYGNRVHLRKELWDRDTSGKNNKMQRMSTGDNRKGI